MTPEKIEFKLAADTFELDRDNHIRINTEMSHHCETMACLYVCPAGCFKLRDGHITFSFEGCLECGSCRIACGNQAIIWSLPKHGFGICYAYG